jgi:eukaryotic-like serine/threonine-protein kinase
MQRRDADRNLLFGITALQNDFISRDALIVAMNAWALEKHRPIGEILVERGDLDPGDREALEGMIARRLLKHGDDPARSLAALSSIAGVADDLRREVADPDVLASLLQVATESQLDPHATRAPETTDYLPVATRYRKVRDHAKGGLGIVYVAHDEELRREVALKEIKPEFADNLASQSRFVLEAEITGGLEHPGIVPVYGLGHHDDGRPYYAMRFIRGDSLKHAIAAFHADETLKRDPGARALALQKLLRRFLDVCNAIAYAHSRGVLHRDLKPDNVMVGRYGETLVVDWGLAKATGRPGECAYGTLPEPTLTPALTSGSAETLPGSVVGTPAYMSPEQAAGRLDLLSHTSDVYSLGATLYTLLTGRIPFEERDLGEVLHMVERGAFRRPRECSPWIDPAMEAITLKAMALRPEDRYASARVLAGDIERWLADSPVAAYPEPFGRRAGRWARTHRTAVTSTIATLVVASILIVGVRWQHLDQMHKTDRAGLDSLATANQLASVASATSNISKWAEAIAEARRAEALLESGGGSASIKLLVNTRLDVFQGEEGRLRAAQLVDEKDREMIRRLDEARVQMTNVNKDDQFDDAAMLGAFLAAFRSYGIDLASLSVEEATARIRSSRISEHLIAALDEWNPFRSSKGVTSQHVHAIAKAADSASGQAGIHDAIARMDMATLRQLVRDQDSWQKLGPRIHVIFGKLARLDSASSIPLLEAIRREKPDDFWFNHHLAFAYQHAKPPKPEAALRYFTAANAIRPESPGAHVNLTAVLWQMGDIDGAMAASRKAIRLKPDYSMAHSNLGGLLLLKKDFDGAIAACREAIRLNPGNAAAHNNLDLALKEKGDRFGRIEARRELTRVRPADSDAFNSLGAILKEEGDIQGAVADYQEAARLRPTDPDHFNGLGLVLAASGNLDRAIDAYREAIRLRPDHRYAPINLMAALRAKGDVVSILREETRLHPSDSAAFNKLGWALRDHGDIEGAIVAYHEATRLSPADPEHQNGLGIVLSSHGDLRGAVTAFREAIRLRPDHQFARLNLANALRKQGDAQGAIAVYREEVRLRPENAEAYWLLGNLLKDLGLLEEALKSLVRSHELGSGRPDWRRPSAEGVRICRRLLELEAKLPALLKGEIPPLDPGELVGLADICSKKALHASASRLYGQAFSVDSKQAEDLNAGHRYNAACVAALAGSGTGKDEPPPDDLARAKLREQALDGGDAIARQALVKTLAHWKEHSDLAGIRDEASLAKLPEKEREAFRALWADVEALRVKASAGK